MAFSLTHEDLCKNLSYDSETGEFTRIKSNTNCVKIGDRAGSVAKNGYIEISVCSHRYYAHRLAWFYTFEEWPSEVDHINRNRSDNRICNLRTVTHEENMKNTTKRTDNTSGYTGIARDKRTGKWIARIGNKHWLGRHKTLEEAIIARKKGEIKFGYMQKEEE